ncbi:MAG: glycosyltransferase family 4 protein [Ignavibacteriales bacterium]|nr:glycosyltransferase family 4 protein [Ignavibacteriales bacterium]
MKKILKVLHVCSSRAWGGGEISAVKLAKSFKDYGHEIYFVAHPKGRIIDECRTLGIPTFGMNLLRNIDPISSYKLRKIINKFGIEIVHVHMSRDLVHIYLATRFLMRTPCLVFQKQVSSKLVKKDLFHRIIYSKVDKIFVLSNFLRENILETCPVSGGIVKVIPGGVNISLYNVDKKIRSRIRGELKILEDTLVIGTISRIDRAKGLSELVNAFSGIKNQTKQVKLVIVGEPTYGEENYNLELRELVNNLSLNDSVLFTGYRDDIPQILSSFDIFALPSYEEAFGYVFIEAMAAGLPVVSTNAGGVKDIIQEGINGFTIPPRDIFSIRDCLLKLLNDGEYRLLLGDEGRKIVKEKFDEAIILKKYEDEYYSLI